MVATAAVGVVTALHVWPVDTETPLPKRELELDFGGPVGDRHHGLTMSSDTRQRWLYPSGTQIRNNRQVSVVDLGELARVAERLGLEELAAGTVADNICTDGLDRLSQLPPMSRLVFSDATGEAGAVVVVLGRNNPCTIAGALVQRRYGTAPEKFPKASFGQRGVTGWVERPGLIRPGAQVRIIDVQAAG